jgi:hypothetical protein
MNARAFRRWLWIGAGAGALVWTLLTWSAYVLVAFTGDAFSGGANWFAGYPEAQYWLGWSVRIAEQFGVALLVTAWSLGMLLLAAGAWVVSRLLTVAQRTFDAR